MNALKSFYDYPPFHFVQEIDGVRILSPSKHELLQKVPETLEEIFRIGANGPAAMLYEASMSFYKVIFSIKKKTQSF